VRSQTPDHQGYKHDERNHDEPGSPPNEDEIAGASSPWTCGRNEPSNAAFLF
jgi:hypothetical protein